MKVLKLMCVLFLVKLSDAKIFSKCELYSILGDHFEKEYIDDCEYTTYIHFIKIAKLPNPWVILNQNGASFKKNLWLQITIFVEIPKLLLHSQLGLKLSIRIYFCFVCFEYFGTYFRAMSFRKRI